MSEHVLDAKVQQKQFILKENLWKVMFHLSWPSVIDMVLYGFNKVLDGIFVGQFVGESAVAGVTLAYPITQLSTAFGSLIGIGAGCVLSIATDGRDKHTQNKVLGNVNILTILCTLLYMIPSYIFAHPHIAMMGVDGAAWGTNVGMFAYSRLALFCKR